ncbi:MAG: response regulator transcription factor [Dehalococcoidia bacterium]|nr:response regulator transcription factor [Dehalococcoidia bacterium]
MVSLQQSTLPASSQTIESLLSVLHINGGIVVRPKLARNVPVDAEPLTEREREVLSLVAEGNSNKQVAASLRICEGMVKNHLTCGVRLYPPRSGCIKGDLSHIHPLSARSPRMFRNRNRSNCHQMSYNSHGG